MRLIVLALLAALALPAPAIGGEGPPELRERPKAGQPLRYADAAGHVFRPERLVLAGPGAARAASLPASTHRASSEERVDLSGLPLLGHVFPERLAPGDARRKGTPVGPVTRIGSTLVVEVRDGILPLAGRETVLTANLPRHGAVSYRLGRLAFAPASPPAGPGRPAGSAWLVGETLVLAGPGREPLLDGWERVFDKIAE